MDLDTKIDRVKHLHREIVCKQISCNVVSDIERKERELCPLRDSLIEELKQAGVLVSLNGPGAVMNGMPFVEVRHDR